jgi:hypothetical protein
MQILAVLLTSVSEPRIIMKYYVSLFAVYIVATSAAFGAGNATGGGVLFVKMGRKAEAEKDVATLKTLNPKLATELGHAIETGNEE